MTATIPVNGTNGLHGTNGINGTKTAESITSSSRRPNGVNGVVNGTGDGREPRFSLPDATPRSSKTSLVISGVRIYIYGLDDLPPSSAGNEVAVLYLAHNRTRTYRVTEGIAHEVLHRYRSDGRRKRMGLIAVTMDMRNHGEREISAESNRTWSDGNERHAMDILSLIDGGAQDFQLVMDYLPVYLPQFARLHNVMAGISLGGHTAWRLASRATPGQIAAYIIVVGCPNLTSLLLARLGVETKDFNGVEADTDPCRLDRVSYDRLQLVLDDQQRGRWPSALAELVRAGDRRVAEDVPADVPMLLCNGAQDELVPPQYTVSWVESRRQQTKKQPIDLFVQDNTGHSCTKEMVARMATWLVDMFETH